MSQCLWWHHASWNKRYLKQALNHRLLFKQIHRVIKFSKNGSKKVKSDFKKDFFKGYLHYKSIFRHKVAIDV